MDLRETSLGFYRAWHAGLGARHGLFAEFAGWRAPPTVFHDDDRDPGAIARWCEGAWALGLLERDGDGRYRLAPAHAKTLGDPSSPEYMGYHFDYLTRKSLTFGELDTAFRKGPAESGGLASIYAVATSYDHLAFFETFLGRHPDLEEALTRGIDVLDLGAGEGGWTREARRRYPRSRVVAADLGARRIGGVEIVALGSVPEAAFDLVFMGEVLAAAEDPLGALHDAARFLRPGGRIVVLEGLRPPEGRAPVGWGETLVLAMGLDFAMDGSEFPTEEEARVWVRDAGFRAIEVVDLGGSLFATTARKA